MERFDILTDFLDIAWLLLLNASVKRKHPMGTPVLGTTDGHRAHLRTVVLRKTNPKQRTLLFFSDFRAAKIVHLQHNAQISCLFYHPKKQVQIRTTGIAHLHHQDDFAASYWSNISPNGRKNYATTLHPGSETAEYTDGLPKDWNSDIDMTKTDFAFENFVVIEMEVLELEILSLHRAGHQRARFDWENDRWEGSWLIP